ncbi:MAG TPA: TIGR00374 family protein, partial [Actinotalea sp.]|nr:TIGR00374 family protein [Actinotalea sp.]
MTASGVQVVDRSSVRVHSPEDAIGAVLAALGLAAVMLLAVYAHATTTGVTEDVQGFEAVVGQVLVIPVAVLAGIVAVAVPVGVLLDLALRGSGRQVLEAVVGAFGSAVVALAVVAMVAWLGSDLLKAGLAAPRGGVSVPLEWATLAGLLTVVGPRAVRRSVAWSQNAVGVAVGLQLVAGRLSLAGVAAALLIGKLVGSVVRLVAGVPTERAYGPALVDGLHRVGIRPTTLVRRPGDGARTYEMTTA